MATPRYQTVLDDSLPSWADEIERKADEFGTPLLPWQKIVAKYIGSLKEDGVTPRYNRIVVTVPRQSGKTTIAKAALAARAEREQRQKMLVFAQNRTYAVRHLEDLALDLELAEYDVKYNRGLGAERLFFPNGTVLEPQASNPKSAHGLSVDFALLDEVWAIDKEVLGGILPATVAKPRHQLLFISTMGTHESELWNDLVAAGRESVENPDSTIAYLEYAADSDDDVFDEGKWYEWMPALGHTQTVEAVRGQLEILPPYEFIRAFGNRLTAAVTSIFPQEWVEDAWRVIQPPQKFVVAIDVNDEPAGAALATGHVTDDGNVAARVVRYRIGTPTWVPAELDVMLSKRQVEAVVVDLAGPARQIASQLEAVCERRRVPLVNRTSRDVAADTLAFYDALRERRVHLEESNSEPLADALTGAYKKQVGDLWFISRNRMVADASPLIATILACGLAVELDVKPVIKGGIY